MIEAVRCGASQRAVARAYRVSVGAVQYWVKRAGDGPLDAVDWRTQASRPHTTPSRTAADVEAAVLALRAELRETSDLGEYGARAIRAALPTRGIAPVPSERTVNRILARQGAFDGLRRRRTPPPPRGWYLPAVAAGAAELDAYDIIEGLVLEGDPAEVLVLTGIALHSGLVLALPCPGLGTEEVLAGLVGHWCAVGYPPYVQFDNDTRFQGPHQHSDVVGRVTRLCLQLGITPVFAPPRELGFQAAIESFNGRWQAKVWTRFHHDSLLALENCSARYVTAVQRRVAARVEAAPARTALAADWQPEWRRPPTGTVIFLRRTDDQGRATVLGHPFPVAAHWVHRLVRAEIQLPAGPIRFYALRRRDPASQPLLNEVAYQLPDRRRKG